MSDSASRNRPAEEQANCGSGDPSNGQVNSQEEGEEAAAAAANPFHRLETLALVASTTESISVLSIGTSTCTEQNTDTQLASDRQGSTNQQQPPLPNEAPTSSTSSPISDLNRDCQFELVPSSHEKKKMKRISREPPTHCLVCIRQPPNLSRKHLCQHAAARHRLSARRIRRFRKRILAGKAGQTTTVLSHLACHCAICKRVVVKVSSSSRAGDSRSTKVVNLSDLNNRSSSQSPWSSSSSSASTSTESVSDSEATLSASEENSLSESESDSDSDSNAQAIIN